MIYRHFIFWILLIITIIKAQAQIKTFTYFDLGETEVSNGMFLKNSFGCELKHNSWILEPAIQLDYISESSNFLSGVTITGGREFKIWKYPMEVKGFYLLDISAENFYESNWGAYLHFKRSKHFRFKLGLNNRTYTIYKSIREENNIKTEDAKLREYFNLIYCFGAFLKPVEHNWNVGIHITNFDYFLMNQSTNPIFNIQGKYKYKSKFEFFSELWYKEAGMFNISVNNFGYTIRIGMKWIIK